MAAEERRANDAELRLRVQAEVREELNWAVALLRGCLVGRVSYKIFCWGGRGGGGNILRIDVM